MRYLPSYSPIGLDLDGRWLRLAQTVRVNGRERLHAAARVERLGSGALDRREAEFISNLIDWHGFQRAPLVVGLPRAAAVSAALELPPVVGGAPAAQIARLELARSARCEPDEIDAAFWPVPAPARSGEGLHVLAVGARRALIGDMLDALDGAGLRVAALDTREWGLVRGGGAWVQGAGLRCLIEVGWEATTLVLSISGTIVFTRVMELSGLARLFEVVCQRRGIATPIMDALLERPESQASAHLWEQCTPTLRDFSEALLPEIRRSLAYIGQRHPGVEVTGALLCGDGAAIPGLAAAVGAAGGVACRIVSPADVIAMPEGAGRACASPGMVCALGLSMHQAALAARSAAA
ncbi:MAG: hypothetical protein DYG92_02605 [Leptolyngbya sp. PLA1]|nr:hypothetical protein [Leptolyngbya sp. PLA1]